MGGLGQLRTKDSIDKAMVEIRSWLERLNISGLDLNINYDPRQNIALVRFKYKGKDYEFRSTKQDNCRLNMHAVARVMEFKVRAHLMDIEQFDTSMSPYLAIGTASSPGTGMPKQNYDAYAVLGIEPTASNVEIIRHIKEMQRRWHPDTVEEASKLAFEKRFKEISEAADIIKKERGIE